MGEQPIKRPWLWALFAVALLCIPALAALRARAHAHPRLPSYGRVPDFALTDQLGRPLGAADLDGKVWVADFVFTGCSQVCPRLTAEMARLQLFLQNRGADGRTRLVSISVDPERDTPERLRGYAEGFHANPALWKFVTGPAGAVEDAVVRGFKVGVTREPDEHQADGFAIVHGTRFVLVDGKRQIRGYYDAADPIAMEQLRQDLQALLEKGSS